MVVELVGESSQGCDLVGDGFELHRVGVDDVTEVGDLMCWFQVRFLPIDLESETGKRVSSLSHDPCGGFLGPGQEQEVVDVAGASDPELHTHVGLNCAGHLGEDQRGVGKAKAENEALVSDWLTVWTRGFELEVLPVVGENWDVKESIGKVH